MPSSDPEAPLKVLILGGSNSFDRAGYLKRAHEVLTRYASRPVEFLNLSIGGVTTATAIDQLLSLPTETQVDLVLYEYGGTDVLLLSRYENALDLHQLLIRQFLGLLAQRFPHAAVMPLFGSARNLFAQAARNPLYDAQRALWAKTGAVTVDFRERLSVLFAGLRPDWLFSDPLHYRVPEATDIIGSLLGRAIVQWLKQPDFETVAESHARLEAGVGASAGRLVRYGASELLGMSSGPCEIVERSNSLMKISALRLCPGAAVRVEGRVLLNIGLLSDIGHDWAVLERRASTGAETRVISTRANRLDDMTAHDPAWGGFIFTGIPAPALLPHPLDPAAAEPAVFELRLDPPEAEQPVLTTFGMFNRDPRRREQPRRLDISGMIMVEPA